MNKWQREVLGNRIASEETILKELKRSYKQALKDIDDKLAKLIGRLKTEEGEINKDSIEYQIGHQKSLQTQIKAILEQMNTQQFESISAFLQQCYEDGFIGTMYDLQHQGIPLTVPIDQKNVVKALKNNSKLSKGLWGDLADDNSELQARIRAEISRGISQGSSYDKISKLLAEHMSIGYSKAARIVRTESHRISQEATLDAQYKAKDKGADIVKQWDASLDGRTRKEHRKLDGQIRELDEPFEVGGLKAMCPGKFNRPEHDINCRCTILQRAKWALDEDELKTLEERAKYFKLDKTKDFEEYKKKYIESVDKMEQMGNNVVDPNIVFNEKTEAQLRKMVEEGKYGDASEDEISVLVDSFNGYIGTGNSWGINDALRNNTTEKLSPETQNTIKTLKEVINRNTLDENIRMNRYVSYHYLNSLGEDVKNVLQEIRKGQWVVNEKDIARNPNVIKALNNHIGEKITHKGFTSGSLVKGMNVFDSHTVEIKIEAVKGTHAYLTQNIYESEIILNDEQSFILTEANYNEETDKIELTLRTIVEE